MPSAGLVAAYALDETSGTVVSDKAGTNTGSVSGATWVTGGRYGGALSFDGANDWVTIPDASALDLTTAMTLEAWVRPSALGSRLALSRLQGAGKQLRLRALREHRNEPAERQRGHRWHRPRHPRRELAGTEHVDSPCGNLRRRQLAPLRRRCPRRHPGSDRLDRHLDRRSSSGWQPDLGRVVRGTDRRGAHLQPRSDPGGDPVGHEPEHRYPGHERTERARNAQRGRRDFDCERLAGAPRRDNVGVSRYNVHRSATPGFTPSVANRIAQPTGTSYGDTGLSAGTYYYRVTAEDAAGNVGPATNEASAIVTERHVRSDRSVEPGGDCRPGAGRPHMDGIDRQRRRRTLRRPPSHDRGLLPSAANRIAQPTTPGYTDGSLPAGTYYYKVIAADASRKSLSASNEASATVTCGASGRPRRRLRVRRGHRDDASLTPPAAATTAPVAGPTWTIGKFGTALSFDGIERLGHDPGLQLTRPHERHDARSVGAADRARHRVAHGRAQGAERATTPTALYANTGTSRPSGNAVTGGVDHDLRGSASLALDNWVHLAATYDGANLRLYVDGTLVGTQAAAGSISVSSGRASDRRHQRVPGRVLPGADRRSAGLQPRADPGRAPGRHDGSRSDGHPQPDGAVVTPAACATNVVIDGEAHGDVQRGDEPGHDHDRHLRAARWRRHPRPRDDHLRPADRASNADADERARLRHDVHRHNCRAAPTGVKDLSGRSLAADHVWTFTTEPRAAAGRADHDAQRTRSRRTRRDPPRRGIQLRDSSTSR